MTKRKQNVNGTNLYLNFGVLAALHESTLINL